MSTILDLSGYAAKLRASRRDRALIYWEIGDALNSIYGRPPRPIPMDDQVSIVEQLEISLNYVADCRRFAADKDSDTLAKARSVVVIYQNWSNIRGKFLKGLPVDFEPDPKPDPPQPAMAEVSRHLALSLGVSRQRASIIIKDFISQNPGLIAGLIVAEIQRQTGQTVTAAPGTSKVSARNVVAVSFRPAV